jgi:hypothetical protein
MCITPSDITSTQEMFRKIYAGVDLTEEEIKNLKEVGFDYDKLKPLGKLYTVKENVSS